MNQSSRRRLYRFGSSTLALVFDDLLTSEAEVLVSSDDGYLSMGGGVSSDIRQAGGPAIVADAVKLIPAAPGDVLVTTAGALQAHYIFHAVTLAASREAPPLSPSDILQTTTRRCIQLADALGVTSIAFPAIGAGSAGFSYEDVAANMAAAIADELARSKRSVDVSIHLFDPYNPMGFDPFSFAEEFARRESQWQAAPEPAAEPKAKDDTISGADPSQQSTGLKTIKIFLASSSELREDRDAFDLYFRQQNDLWIKKGIYLQIERWETFLDAMSETRLQVEYNQKVRGCDVFMSLFKTKTGAYTEEEFDIAHAAFKEFGKPLIYTYFMQADVPNDKRLRAELNSLWGFQDKLSKLGHYNTKYNSLEDLKLRFKDQLDRLIDEGKV